MAGNNASGKKKSRWAAGITPYAEMGYYNADYEDPVDSVQFNWIGDDSWMHFLSEKLKANSDRLRAKHHWSEASASLVHRLRGIYAVGPNADQSATGQGEFGSRTFGDMPPIQFEAAQRIEDLEAELERLRSQTK